MLRKVRFATVPVASTVVAGDTPAGGLFHSSTPNHDASGIHDANAVPVRFARDLLTPGRSEVSLVALEFPRIPSTAVADV